MWVRVWWQKQESYKYEVREMFYEPHTWGSTLKGSIEHCKIFSKNIK